MQYVDAPPPSYGATSDTSKHDLNARSEMAGHPGRKAKQKDLSFRSAAHPDKPHSTNEDAGRREGASERRAVGGRGRER